MSFFLFSAAVQYCKRRYTNIVIVTVIDMPRRHQ